MPISAVVFDVGGVLERVDDMSWLEPWGRRVGITVDEIGRRLSPFEMDDLIATGAMGEAEFRSRYAEILELDDAGADTFMAQMWDWYCGELDQEMYDFAAGLRPAYRTAILSNSADGARREEQTRYAFEQLVDVIVYSHEVGLAKPDPRIYRHTERVLGVAPDEIVFVDDTALVVEAARACGWHAVRHDAETARTIEMVRAVLDSGRPLRR